jgi:hypothetical protein
MPIPIVPLLAGGSIAAGGAIGAATGSGRNYAYTKFLLPWQDSTLDGSWLNANEVESLRRLAAISYRKPIQGKPGLPGSERGQISYNDYKVKDRKTGQDIPSAGPGTYDIKTLIGRGSVQRVGDEWRISDYYDFDAKDIPGYFKALGNKHYIPALSGVSAQLPWRSEYPVDIRIPMSRQEIMEFGNAPAAQLAIGGKEYDYVPYRFSKGQTLEDVVRKEFGNNQFKPEGANLQRYIKHVNDRNNNAPIPTDPEGTNYYIPIERKMQRQKALSLIDSYIGQALTRNKNA